MFVLCEIKKHEKMQNSVKSYKFWIILYTPLTLVYTPHPTPTYWNTVYTLICFVLKKNNRTEDTLQKNLE